jgi:hypothetical protein
MSRPHRYLPTDPTFTVVPCANPMAAACSPEATATDVPPSMLARTVVPSAHRVSVLTPPMLKMVPPPSGVTVTDPLGWVMAVEVMSPSFTRGPARDIVVTEVPW